MNLIHTLFYPSAYPVLILGQALFILNLSHLPCFSIVQDSILELLG